MPVDVISLILLAFLGGILSIASPCGGLLVPLFFANSFKTKEKFFINSLLFFLGAYSASLLVSAGLYFVFIAFPFTSYLFKFFGFVFIVLGILSLFGKHINIPLPQVSTTYKKRYFSSLLLGVFAALSHGTCCGPILGVIATASARLHNFLLSALIMFFYTFGMVLPFILISFGVDKVNFIKKVFVKGKEFNFLFAKTKVTIHSSNLISFLFFTVSGVMLLYFNGSAFALLNYAKIDLSFMLEYQDALINNFYNR